MTSLFDLTFPKRPVLIAMLHVWNEPEHLQIERALAEAELLKGMPAFLVENYGWGYQGAHNLATEETARALGRVMRAVQRQNPDVAVGVNILPNDFNKALFIAGEFGGLFAQLDHVTGDFVGHESVNARVLQLARRQYGFVALLGGIHPKYYRLAKPELITEAARRAIALTDAIVVTGDATGEAASMEDLCAVRNVIGDHPLIVGSGMTPKNAAEQLAVADGAIIGTALKTNGVRPDSKIDRDRVQALLAVASGVRRQPLS